MNKLETLDIFYDIPDPCKHCGSDPVFVEAESVTYGDCVILECTGCTFKTHRTYIGDKNKPDYKQVIERWNHGTPYPVVSHATAKVMDHVEYYKAFPERKPVKRDSLAC